MDPIDRFHAYAADFERTLADGDWSRVARHFARGATYSVRGTPFDCDVFGREAIVAAMCRSVEGFDRRCDAREVRISGVAQHGARVVARLEAHYRVGHAPALVVTARTIAQCDAGGIVRLTDVYDDGLEAGFGAWFAEVGVALDPRYAADTAGGARLESIFPDLCSTDLAASRDFYAKLFDLVPVFDSDWYVQLQSPARPWLQLAFVRAGHESVPAGFGEPARGVLVTLEVDGVDALHERAVAAGAEIVLSLRDEPWGQRHFMARDPNGVLVDVVEMIPASPEFLRAHGIGG